MKKLGIIGGLGPMATVYFLQLLTQMSDASIDQEHMEIYMISRPSIPDRTGYILGRNDKSPAEEMIEVGRQLKSAGAEILTMPCITGHFFLGEIEKAVSIPVINAVKETVRYLRSRKIERVGILATDGTIKSGLFQNALRDQKIESIVPDENGQRKVMDIIYREIKAGRHVDMETFVSVSGDLRQNGAEVILLACTELSLLKRDRQIGNGYLDVMEILSAKAVKSCNHLKTEYKELIT